MGVSPSQPVSEPHHPAHCRHEEPRLPDHDVPEQPAQLLARIARPELERAHCPYDPPYLLVAPFREDPSELVPSFEVPVRLRFPSPVVFPQIADGGGFVTEFILLNAGGDSKTTLSFFDNEGRQLAVGK